MAKRKGQIERRTKAQLVEELNATKTRLLNERVKLARFKILVSEISIKRYQQKEYAEIINSVYESIKEETAW